MNSLSKIYKFKKSLDSKKSKSPKNHGKSPKKLKSPKNHVKSPKKSKSPKNHVKSPKKSKSPKTHVKSPKKLKSPKTRVKSPKHLTNKNNSLNSFFDKIYIINLFDKIDRWNKVKTQFIKAKIDVDRFIAVDGRCKDQGDQGCKDKLKTFEMVYGVRIPLDEWDRTLQELIPASSLTIGTILILRDMIRNKYKHVLICEDDIEFTDDMLKKFQKGINEIENSQYKDKWDLLYLGCGNQCGTHDISDIQTDKTNNLAQIGEVYNKHYFVNHRNDLRILCKNCKPVSEHISIANRPGGTWCYAFSLNGAKKLLKSLKNNAANHIDQLIGKETEKGKMLALAFDPPIIMHEYLISRDANGKIVRLNTDIPWEF